MSDLTRYINLGCRHMSICDSVEKDTMLQDIADAWRETDKRWWNQLDNPLAALLDALVERGDE